MRKPYIAGNWKMNLTPSEGAAFAKELNDALVAAGGNKDIKIMVAPSFVAIPAVKEALKDSEIVVSSQNVANQLKGAYTGEVSIPMLKDLGIETCIIGHSERRSYYGETDEVINSKVLLALEQGMEVILCVGETLEERQSGKLEEVLKRQIEVGLKDVCSCKMDRVVVAYEPVWAIGTGVTASADDADAAHALIRTFVEKIYSKDIAENLIIQYGGSVKADNVKALMAKENIDGALVGGASLVLKDFLAICTFNK